MEPLFDEKYFFPEWPFSISFLKGHSLLYRFEKLKQIENLVFSGGGPKGISFCAALDCIIYWYKELYNKNFLDQITCCAGTSIGAIQALVCTCNVSWEEFKNLTLNMQTWDTKDLFIHFNSFFETKGINNHSLLFQKLETLFQLLRLPFEITFEELFELNQKTFICNSSCVNDGSIMYMSHKHTPKMKVKDALIMTMSLPFIFDAIELNGKYYVDGGLYENYMMNQFALEKTLGICCDSPGNQDLKLTKGFSWIKTVMLSLSDFLQKEQLSHLEKVAKDHTIFIKTPGILGLTLTIQPEDIVKLFYYGQCSCMMYFFPELLSVMYLIHKMKK